MSRSRIALLCLIGLVFAGFGLGLVKYRHFKEKLEVEHEVFTEDSDIRLNQVHHVATRDGVKEWILDAESVRYNRAGNKAVLKEVSVTFFLKDGKTVHLTGNDGIFLTDTKEMDVFGDVVVRSGAHELKTEKLHYDYANRSISTETPIVILGEGVRLTGGGMSFSFESEQAMVWGGVKAVFENRGL